MRTPTGLQALGPAGYTGGMVAPKLMDYTAIADRLGVKVKVARKYLGDARRHRAEGNPRPGDMPEPDAYYGQSPVWKASTVEKWIARRPGPGVGGGTPSHRKARDTAKP